MRPEFSFLYRKCRPCSSYFNVIRTLPWSVCALLIPPSYVYNASRFICNHVLLSCHGKWSSVSMLITFYKPLQTVRPLLKSLNNVHRRYARELPALWAPGKNASCSSWIATWTRRWQDLMSFPYDGCGTRVIFRQEVFSVFRWEKTFKFQSG